MKRIANLGLLLAAAMILSYVESMIPLSFGIPGMKAGLPNLIVVMILCGAGKTQIQETFWERPAVTAMTVNLLRILLSGFLFGNLFSILYSVAGALCSFVMMQVGRKMGCFSVLGISVLGGAFHNVGQLLMAVLVLQTGVVWYYLPVLLAMGTVTGAVLGLVALTLVPYCRKYNFI